MAATDKARGTGVGRPVDTNAVLPARFGGRPVDIKGIRDLCADKGWRLIEDCAQAHGAEVDTQKVGTFGDVGCFSFCQDQIMSTGGEGGMCITNDEELRERMWSYKDTARTTTPTTRGTGRGILASYLDGLDGVRIPDVPANVRHAYDRFNAYAENRDAVMQRLSQKGIPATIDSSSKDLPRSRLRLERAPPQSEAVAGDEPVPTGASDARGGAHAVGEAVVKAIEGQ